MAKRTYLKSPRCHICGFNIPIDLIDHKHPLFGTIDHIIPRSKGGLNTAENRAPAHKLCNSIKSSRELTVELRARCSIAAATILASFNMPDTKRWRKDREKVAAMLKMHAEQSAVD